MVVEASLPTIATVLITAAVDSINPCAIGVLILLVSQIVVTRSKRQLIKLGMVYIAAIYATYFLAGLGLILFFRAIPLAIAEYISIAVGTVIVVSGLIEIKDFFWYGKGISLSIPAEYAKKIHNYATKMTYLGLIFLGVFAAGVELPCTGGPYLAITLMLSQNFNLMALLLLALYNVIFVMPLVVILVLAYTGTKITALKKWKQKNRAYMRLATGMILIYLGWLLILMANGTINIG
mgnify:CR=1 FL=1